MKKWYFSNNGEISGPMDLTSARKVVEKNSELYSWHPSFTTWKPVTVIGEFSDLINNKKITSQVPKEIINEFNSKKIALSEKLAVVTENIKETELIKAKLKKKITLYKHLTEDLSDDFQSAIISIEQQYSAFSKRLLNLQDAANIAENEIEQVTLKFQEQISNKEKNVEEAASNVRKISTAVESEHSVEKHKDDHAETVIDIDADYDLVDETIYLVEDENIKVENIAPSNDGEKNIKIETVEEIAKDEPAKVVKKISTETMKGKSEASSPEIKRRVFDTKAPDTVRQPIKISTQEHFDKSTSESESSENQVTANAEIAQSSNDNKQNDDSQNNELLVNKITSIDNSEASAKKGLAGVKGMFKSVFKSNEPAPKLSAQLKMSEAIKETNQVNSQSLPSDVTGEVVALKKAVNESETITTVEEDESDKKARRRRRRR